MLMKVCCLVSSFFHRTWKFYKSSELCFKSRPVVAGVDLLEGDIQQDQVRSTASELENKYYLIFAFSSSFLFLILSVFNNQKSDC